MEAFSPLPAHRNSTYDAFEAAPRAGLALQHDAIISLERDDATKINERLVSVFGDSIV